MQRRRERRLAAEKEAQTIQTAAQGNRALWKWFAAGAAMGAVLFVLLYGVAVLDPTNVNWLYGADHDRFQHQIGFDFYRQAPWSWPLGAMPNYCAPSGTAIVFTDSIPLFAIFFKLFNFLLPASFQYFGLFGLFSFMMQGGLSCVILQKSMRSLACALLCVPMFVYMPAIVYRSWGHLALGANWVILLALYIWTYRERFASNRRCAVAWSAVCALSVTIHAYFLPMVGLLMVGFLIDDYRTNRAWRRVLVTLFSAVASALFVFWLIGGFVPGEAGEGHGIGYYSMNLNALWNSMGYGALWPEFPLALEGQYEGFCYLGLGWILLVGLAAGWKLCEWIVDLRRGAWDRARFRRVSRAYGGTWFVCIVCLFLALGCYVSFSETILFTYLRDFFARFLSSFRSTGRLFWPVVYLITFGTAAFWAKRLHKRRALAIGLAVACAVQMVDLSPLLSVEHDRLQQELSTPAQQVLLHPLWQACAGRYRRLAYLTYACPDYQPIARYAVDNHMEMTNGYLARKNWEAMEQEVQRYQAQLLSGTLEQGTMVVVSQDKIFFDSALTDDTLAHFYVDRYHVIVRKDSLNWQAYADALYQP